MKKTHDMIVTLLLAAALLCGGAILYTGGWSAEALPAQWVTGNPCEEDPPDEEPPAGPADNMPAEFTG